VYRAPGRDALFPEAVPRSPKARLDRFSCREAEAGIEVVTEGERWGFGFSSRWFLHSDHPWIDVRYDLEGGWSEEPQTVRFCFPLAMARPIYRYDVAGAALVAGPVADGGDDLPGANPALFAAQTYAAAHDAEGGAGLILLTPDALLLEFGADTIPATEERRSEIPALITSLPMMNLTRNDWQLGQGGLRRWTFHYRLVLTAGVYDPLRPIREAQHFGIPPYLQVPGTAAALPALGNLDVRFAGGPVLALKVAEDGERLILRLWNVLDRPVAGSARLPDGFGRAERCDALERPRQELPVERGRAAFAADPRGILTIAFCPEHPGS